MKKNTKQIIFVVLIIVFMCPKIVYANSSWRRISKTRPYDILPFVIIITLVIETFGICYICKIKSKIKSFIVISFANLTSFVLPEVINYFNPSFKYIDLPLREAYFAGKEHWPQYTIGPFYYVLTIGIELPIVYFLSKKNQQTRKD